MPERFQGVIGRTVEESTPWWPDPVRAEEGAPNVLYIVLDDVGFGHLAPFGGLCETPNLDRLAANGLRYRNFHTTALCSPTRTCVLTGRNHHSNAMAGIVENSTGFPGYSAVIPFENGFISEMLTRHGYAAYAVGKWHLTPHPEMNMAAPRERWPLGRGFERFYGFLGGDTNQWEPELVHDNHRVHPPRTAEQGYHLTEDLADRAVEYITDLKNVAPDKPFFLYFCTGAAHAPHHVPKEWIERYRGRFDIGWDAAREQILAQQLASGIVPPDTVLTPRPSWIPAWDSLPADEQRLYARMMEVFAAFVSHTDHHIGRLLDFLEEIGELDNTITVVISDNGASAEGGPHGSLNETLFFNMVPESLEENLAMIDELGGPHAFNHYPFGWTWAGNTPFQRWKREVHEGGVTDPCIISWPRGIAARGEVRGQYIHAVDVTPTVLELLRIEPPDEIRGVTQSPIEGISFAETLADPDAPGRHETQYYEMLGNRAIYHRGWKATTYHGTEGMIYDGVTDPTRPFDEDVWELYHVAEDFSESRDVAAEHPEKLRELQERWWVEAGKYNVLPLDYRGFSRPAGQRRPRITRSRRQFVYYPGGAAIESDAAVNIMNRSHTITADVVVADGGSDGVLLAQGGRFGGYSLYVQGGRLHYMYNFVGVERYHIVSDVDVPAGACTLGFAFEKTGPERFGAGGIGRLSIGDRIVGEGKLPQTVRFTFGLGGELEVGRNSGNPVTEDYASPFAFTGRINRVAVEVSGTEQHDAKQEARIALARE